MTPQQLADMVEASRKRLWTFCVKLTRNADDADDLFGDTMLKAIEHAHKITHMGTVMKIAEHEFIAKVRRECRQVETVSLDEGRAVSHELSPEEFAIAKDEWQSIQKAIGELSPARRQSLTLSLANDVRTAADMIGISPSSVREYNRRAVKDLKAKFA